MTGYTVACSIDLIDTICLDPAKYPNNMIKQAMNDAKVHYEYGNASKDWYESVKRVLSEYT